MTEERRNGKNGWELDEPDRVVQKGCRDGGDYTPLERGKSGPRALQRVIIEGRDVEQWPAAGAAATADAS
jgi:hypothetical protein